MLYISSFHSTFPGRVRGVPQVSCQRQVRSVTSQVSETGVRCATGQVSETGGTVPQVRCRRQVRGVPQVRCRRQVCGVTGQVSETGVRCVTGQVSETGARCHKSDVGNRCMVCHMSGVETIAGKREMKMLCSRTEPLISWSSVQHANCTATDLPVIHGGLD